MNVHSQISTCFIVARGTKKIASKIIFPQLLILISSLTALLFVITEMELKEINLVRDEKNQQKLTEL